MLRRGIFRSSKWVQYTSWLDTRSFILEIQTLFLLLYISNISRLSKVRAEEIRKNPSRFQIYPRADLEFIAQRWPWFARVWVLQELVQSPDPWVQIGSQRVKWNTFTCIANSPTLFGFDPHGLKHLEDMDRLRNSLSSPLWRGDLQDDTTVATRLLEILHNRRGLGVSDPRDMIYVPSQFWVT